MAMLKTVPACWCTAAAFALSTLALSAMTVLPAKEGTRETLLLVSGMAAALFAAFVVYSTTRKADHWVNRSTSLRCLLTALCLLATLVSVLLVGG
jgi:hypothetical protein